jgi:hypothetical protein
MWARIKGRQAEGQRQSARTRMSPPYSYGAQRLRLTRTPRGVRPEAPEDWHGDWLAASGSHHTLYSSLFRILISSGPYAA